MVRKTRKVNSKEAKASSKTGMTIPQLRKAFEHIDRWTSSHSGDLEGFRSEWKKTFGKEVSKEAARDYLDFVKGSKKTQKGGGAGGSFVSPAPLGYDMRAGADLPYGSFQEYINGGFPFPADSLKLDCATDTTPKLPAEMGSNQVKFGGGRVRRSRKAKKQSGGGISSAIAEFMTRPFGMGSPPSALQDAQNLAKGSPETLPSPRPEINPLPYTIKPTLYNASIATTSRAF